MITFLAHRGLWSCSSEKNSAIAFHSALKNGYGIETDLRDSNGELVISHDIPVDSSMSFREFIQIVNQYEPQMIAINIKSDGLQDLLAKEIGSYEQYFVFDMSVPDAIGYRETGLNFFTRHSDIEKIPPLLEDAIGVWFDCFSSNRLDENSLSEYLALGKKIVLVSPELHGFEHLDYWNKLRCYIEENPSVTKNITLCTDFPFAATEFFNNER